MTVLCVASSPGHSQLFKNIEKLGVAWGQCYLFLLVYIDVAAMDSGLHGWLEDGVLLDSGLAGGGRFFFNGRATSLTVNQQRQLAICQ